MSLLEVDKINSYYGDSHILFDVSMRVEENEVVALLGRNGAGKSTTLKSLMGVVQPKSGAIRHKGEDVGRLPPYMLARRGIQLVPEERRIFGQITVQENLQLAAMSAERARSLDDIYATFPRLAERRRNRGKQLSGGEQQMLAMGRAMVARPRLLLLDEPSMGLAPLMVERVFEVIRRIAGEGVTILLIEQNARLALETSQRGYVMESGRIILQGPSAGLLNDPKVRAAYLGEEAAA